MFAAVHNKWEMNEALGLGMWVINSALLTYWEKGQILMTKLLS